MRLFRIRNKKTNIPDVSNGGNKKRINFSVPFLTVGNGTNLSKPFLSLFRGGSGFEYFGANNLYPNYLEQAYYLSPIHSACIDLTVNTAFDRYEIDYNGKEIDGKVFEIKNELYTLIEMMMYNLKIHDSFYIKVTKGDVPKLEVIDCGKVRINTQKTIAYISEDWSINYKIDRLPINDYSKPVFMVMYQRKKIGSSTYVLPNYNSILNDIEAEQEITYMKSNAIKNSIYPSMVITIPKLFDSQKEADELKDAIHNKKGATDAGDVIVMTADGKENLPEITQLSIKAQGLDGLFETNEKSIKGRILLAHNVHESLLMATSGKLGQSNELQELYATFIETIVTTYKNIVQIQLNKIIANLGLKYKIEIFELDYKKMFNADSKKDENQE